MIQPAASLAAVTAARGQLRRVPIAHGHGGGGRGTRQALAGMAREASDAAAAGLAALARRARLAQLAMLAVGAALRPRGGSAAAPPLDPRAEARLERYVVPYVPHRWPRPPGQRSPAALAAAARLNALAGVSARVA